MTATYHLKVDRQLRVVTADEILADLEASGIAEPEPEFMTTKEVAAALGVSLEKVRYHSNTGTLPEAYRTAANHRRFRTADVRALQQELSTSHDTPTRLPARGRGTYVPAQPSPRAGTPVAAAGYAATGAAPGGCDQSTRPGPLNGGRGEGGGNV